jgi:G:T-mismatch repair DNA endonuclease (very short patch repair protein)
MSIEKVSHKRRGHSEATKQKISASNTGKVFSKERKEAISRANKKKLSSEFIAQARAVLSEKCCSFEAAIRHLGIKPTKAVRLVLEEQGVEICEDLKFFNWGIDYPTGKKLLSYLKLNVHWCEIQERTGLTQKQIDGARLKLEKAHGFSYKSERKKPGGYKPSKIELQVQSMLDEMGAEYEPEFHHGNFFYDFRIRGTSLLIEVNGDYWHANPKVYLNKELLNETQKKMVRRDHYKRRVAREHGYYVLYLWEHDLKNQPDAVRVTLERYIKNAREKANSLQLL